MRIEPDEQTNSVPMAGAVPVSTSLSALRSAAMRLSDTRKKPRLKTRDLVGLLLSHSARAWRSSMPFVRVKLAVTTPTGSSAVKLNYKRPA